VLLQFPAGEGALLPSDMIHVGAFIIGDAGCERRENGKSRQSKQENFVIIEIIPFTATKIHIKNVYPATLIP
jgi:hypothetical protein